MILETMSREELIAGYKEKLVLCECGYKGPTSKYRPDSKICFEKGQWYKYDASFNGEGCSNTIYDDTGEHMSDYINHDFLCFPSIYSSCCQEADVFGLKLIIEEQQEMKDVILGIRPAEPSINWDAVRIDLDDKEQKIWEVEQSNNKKRDILNIDLF